MNTRKRTFVFLGMVVMVAVGLETMVRQLAAAPFDAAAIITVTTTDDELNNDGDCSLREAIQAANQNVVVDNCAAGVGDDEIILPAGTYTLTLPGGDEDDNATGDLDILSNLTIIGAGAISTTIDGGAIDRVLHIPSLQAQVVVNQVKVRNGLAPIGGAILNSGVLTLTHSIISANKAEHGGGGIFNDGILTVTHSIISANETNANGGGIANAGPLTVADSIIRNNHAVNFNSQGGGIASWSALTMTNSTISGNTSVRYGGGLHNNGAATLTAVTISGNHAAEQGAGVLNGAGSPLLLINSTLRDNGASSVDGGAISTAGPITLTNSTISGNYAAYGAGIYVQLDTVTLNHSTISANRARAATGILSGFRATVILEDSIVADQLEGGDCLNPDGMIISAGNNLDSDNSCHLTGAGDIPGGNAALGPLQDNGGPTWTHALLPGSAAIDQGACLGGALATDQRGVIRPQGTTCDIGSYETTGAAIDLRVTPDLQTIASGDKATFTLAITNTGSIMLTNVTVVDKLTPACEQNLGNLSPLSATTYQCERPAVMTPFSNVIRVTASTALGDRVHAEGAGIVKLTGWSDQFLPVVINTTQTFDQR